MLTSRHIVQHRFFLLQPVKFYAAILVLGPGKLWPSVRWSSVPLTQGSHEVDLKRMSQSFWSVLSPEIIHTMWIWNNRFLFQFLQIQTNKCNGFWGIMYKFWQTKDGKRRMMTMMIMISLPATTTIQFFTLRMKHQEPKCQLQLIVIQFNKIIEVLRNILNANYR